MFLGGRGIILGDRHARPIGGGKFIHLLKIFEICIKNMDFNNISIIGGSKKRSS